MRFFGLLALFFVLTTAISAYAQDQLTYEGQLTDDNGIIVPDAAYNLRFQIRSNDANNCLLHDEIKSVLTENGQFIVHLNDGTGSVTPTGIVFKNIFTSNTLSPNSCASGSSTLGTARVLKISLEVAGSWVDLGSVALTTSPFAFRAHQIGPFSESQLLRTDMGVAAPQLDGAKVVTLNDLLSGSYSGNAATATTCSSLSAPLPLTNTSGTLPVTRGGTGAITQPDALNNLLPPQSGQVGKILQTDGTSASWASPPTGGGTGLTALTGDVTASGTGSVAATIANNAVTSIKILDGTILGPDLDFNGVNTATSSFTLKDSTGKFSSFACTTAGHVPTWTAAGFICQAPSVTETDPKVGTNTTNALSKWNGTALVGSAVYENAGNLGLGTTSPSSVLHLYRNNSDATLSIESDSSPTTKDARAIFKQNTTEGTIGFVQSGGGFVVGTISPTPFLFYTNGAEQMRIDPTGKLGIGTNSPSEKIDVVGKIKGQEFCLGTDCRSAWGPALATTGSLTLYVSVSGNDTNPGTSTLPFRTIQRAIDAVPQKVLHPVLISIAPGTYSPMTSSSGDFPDSWLLISKDIHYQSGGFLTLLGSGGVQLQNANTGWEIGITIASPAQGVRLEGLTIANFPRSQILVDGGVVLIGNEIGSSITLNSSPASENALEISNGGQANLENLTANGFSKSGISIEDHSSLRISSGTTTLNMPSTVNHVNAISVQKGGQLETEGGMLTINGLSNPSNGASVINVSGGKYRNRGGSFTFSGVNMNTNIIRSQEGGVVNLETLPTWSGTAGSFLSCSQNSTCSIGNFSNANMTLMSMSANRLFEISDQSSLTLTQPVQIGSGMTSVQAWFDLRNQSILSFEKSFTNSSSLSGGTFIQARNGSTIQLRENFTTNSGQPNSWFDLANNSRLQASMNVSLGAGSVAAFGSPISITENSSGIFEQSLTLGQSSGSSPSLFLRGNSSILVRQITTLKTASSAVRMEQNSSAEFNGAFSAAGSGYNMKVVSVSSGSSLILRPQSPGTNITVGCSGGSANIGFDVNDRSSILFEGSSGLFSTSPIVSSCDVAAIQTQNLSHFAFSPGMTTANPITGTISISRMSRYSKGGTTGSPATCPVDSLCD